MSHAVLQDFSLPEPLGANCPILPQVSLAELTSFRVGGPAQWFVAPRTLEEFQASWHWAKQADLAVTVLGAGSNLLISDRGLAGLVISTKNLRYLHFDPQTGQMTAGAGRTLPKLAFQSAKRGWSGLEWAVGIPGTVGGAIVMNAGAHGGCTADYLRCVQVLEADGTITELTPAQLDYGYRSSNLQGSQRLVLQATFQLQPGFEPEQVKLTTQSHLDHRLTTQPYHLPSCGSVFRNPLPQAAGQLIEQTGLKGYQIGGAQVANQHANFILNCGGATATDIFQLIQYVQQRVADRWSVLLKPEVKMLGEFCLG
uniref:UDP-N-acetylenolpyruvoylglucosamine reductase n=1 Tax=Cyanothece sp. (strain PCC 7425 / ATCC 29141) TaxID=395961 RepID=B8HWY1_CYAP4